MLWRYRKEILLVLFLLLASLITTKSSNCKILWTKKNDPPSPQKELFSPKRIELEKIFINEILSENRRLHKILRLKEKSPYNFRKVARVIRIEPVGWPTSILLDSGKEQFIEKGMVVLDQNGSLVGRVIKVNKNTSLVRTLLHPKSKVSVLIESTRDVGILSGGHPGSLGLNYLPKESGVRKGDIMLTSGLSTLYPKGLPIGKVLKIAKKKTFFFLNVTVNPAVSFSKLEEVLIIR